MSNVRSKFKMGCIPFQQAVRLLLGKSYYWFKLKQTNLADQVTVLAKHGHVPFEYAYYLDELGRLNNNVYLSYPNAVLSDRFLESFLSWAALQPRRVEVLVTDQRQNIMEREALEIPLQQTLLNEHHPINAAVRLDYALSRRDDGFDWAVVADRFKTRAQLLVYGMPDFLVQLPYLQMYWEEVGMSLQQEGTPR